MLHAEPPNPSWSLPDGEGITLRVATSADLKELMTVERAAHLAPWGEVVMAREFDIDFSQIWCAEIHPPTWGQALSGFLVFWRVHDELHILNVAVHPMAQRRGVGRGLVGRLIRWGEAHDISLITLEVRRSNIGARALYEQTGFEHMGTRPNYYQDNSEDAVIMTRLIDR